MMGWEPSNVPDTAWDIVDPGAPALFSVTGPGVDRSVKPDLHHIGGRALYTRPVIQPSDDSVSIELAETATTGPGLQVAAPGRAGVANATVFTPGTSNATALVTREASRLVRRPRSWGARHRRRTASRRSVPPSARAGAA